MIIVGIDVAKEDIDVCILLPDKQNRYQNFPNTHKGMEELHRNLKLYPRSDIHI